MSGPNRLTYNDLSKIEKLNKKGLSPREIKQELGLYTWTNHVLKALEEQKQ